LGEILLESHGLTTGQVADAVASQPAGVRLGEHLVRIGLIGEEDLYSALSRQNSVPLGIPDGDAVSLPVTRALPAALARRLRVLPFRIAAGELYLAGPDLPGDAAHEDIRRFSSLDIRFHLVTPAEFEELADRYLSK
jgi:type IV pilus assembly protein PilB